MMFQIKAVLNFQSYNFLAKIFYCSHSKDVVGDPQFLCVFQAEIITNIRIPNYLISYMITNYKLPYIQGVHFILCFSLKRWDFS